MTIKKVINKHGVNVYHVQDEGCIQEFNTIKEANDYVRYIRFQENLKKEIIKKTKVNKKFLDEKFIFIQG